MKIMIESKSNGHRYYYTKVKDMIMHRIDGERYIELIIDDPEQTNPFIPCDDVRIYETGWCQIRIEE